MQGSPADIGGYYRPDADKAAAVMRPSATFNEALASLGELVSETRAPDAPRPPDIGRRTLSAVRVRRLRRGADPDRGPRASPTCTSTTTRSSWSSGDRIRILTSDWEPGDPADQALATGELVLGDDGCLRLDAGDGTQVDLVWPADYEATVQRVGPSRPAQGLRPGPRHRGPQRPDPSSSAAGSPTSASTPAVPCAPSSGAGASWCSPSPGRRRVVRPFEE